MALRNGFKLSARLTLRCLRTREKQGIGAKHGIGTPPAPGKNRRRHENMTCKSLEQEENHKKLPASVVGNK